jgi:HEAT repeat protein
MQKHRDIKISLVVALGLAVLLCVLLVSRLGTIQLRRVAGQPEPFITGKPLTGWMADWHDTEKGERARTVVHQWATNSLPLLLDWLNLREPLDTQGFFEPAFVAGVDHFLSKLKIPPLPLTLRWRPNKTQQALWFLHELGPAAKPAIPGLLPLLNDNDEELAAKVSELLSELAPDSIPGLIETISGGKERASVRAARTLESIGPEARTAIPALRVLLGSSSSKLRYAGAHALYTFGEPPVALIPPFVEAMKGKNEAIASEACAGLKDMVPLSVPYLTHALSNRTERVQVLAGNALGELGVVGKVQPAVLRSMLLSDVLGVRFAGARALHELGEEPSKIIPIFVEGIQHGDHDMRGYSFSSPGRMGSLAKPAVPGLLTIMTNAAPDDVRFNTVWTLAKIDAPKLVTVLTNVADPDLRSSLTRALIMADSETAAAAGIKPITRKTAN